MIPSSHPLSMELVLVGGGHAHALVLRRWGMHTVPGARLTLINPGPTAPYTGMLPGFVAGHYERSELDIDLVRLARFAGARLILGRAIGIDTDAKTIEVEGRGTVAYDIASFDVGVTTAASEIAGFDDYVVPAKPMDRFATAWEDYLAQPRQGPVTVLGGGIAGVELALAVSHRLRASGEGKGVRIVEKGALLGTTGEAATKVLRSALADAGIDLIEHTGIASISETHVRLESGKELPSALTIGATGARPWSWVAEMPLADAAGYLPVNDRLQTGDPTIFAVGDCAELTFAPRPKAGVFAVRAAPILHHNLVAAVSGGTTRRFRPQTDYLKLVSTGRKSAVAEKWSRAFSGRWVWDLKTRIDQRFMAKFADLPKMTAKPPRRPVAARAASVRDPEKMLCGGCAAKVGRDALKAALATLPHQKNPGFVARPGDDAAVLQMGDVFQSISTDHLRAFTNDPATLAEIAAIHALGDIWAMGAQPQAVTVSVILPEMRSEMQTAWLAEIMSAADAVVTAAGARIVGGHTSIGAELSIGYTVTGLSERDPIGLDGAQDGDALILTKPLGTGTILAAEMALSARGDVVVEALETMREQQAAASGVLAPEARAMTDVTGFGLAGHLFGICEASGLAARIDLDAVPLMRGALELSKAGQRSTLFEDNRAAVPAGGRVDEPRSALLFDPQTAGGLLAAVPADKADAALAELRKRGYRQASIIGRMATGIPEITIA